MQTPPKNFICLNPDYTSLISFLDRHDLFTSKTDLAIFLKKVPVQQGSFLEIDPFDDEDGGILRIPLGAVILIGTNYSSRLGFHCTEEVDSRQ